MDHVEHTFKLIKHFLSSLRMEILGDMDWYFCSFKHLMLEHNYSNFHDISLFTRLQVEYTMNLLVQVTFFGIQASVQRQVCHLIGVLVAKELM
jgi:hypothetical protein